MTGSCCSQSPLEAWVGEADYAIQQQSGHRAARPPRGWRRAPKVTPVLDVCSSLWLPFTQMESPRHLRRFVGAQGNDLVDAQGRRIFDAVSSIWTTVHGHGHPAIIDAIARQAATLDHATLLGASHPLAEELAQRLAGMLGLRYAFFSGDGASAVEAALKMALQYWQQNGQPERTRFVRLVDAYHGDTAGAMSVSDVPLFKSRFGAVTFESCSYGDSAVLREPDVAAVVVEPTVQAAAGMRIVPRERYESLRAMTPLLIVDEIATGFGRTGPMFAHSALDLEPQIVCLGKGLTGGTLALSATVVSQSVFDAFRGRYEEHKQFFHGHSYAGNPIACAAALASLDLFDRESTLEKAASATRALAPLLAQLQRHPLVREVRSAGLMIGIELQTAHIEAGEADSAAWRIADELYGRGHFTRPIGPAIQLVPPLSSAPRELERFAEDLLHILDEMR